MPDTRLASAVAWSLLLAACATRAPAVREGGVRSSEVEAGGVHVRVTYEDADEAAAVQVLRTLPAAATRAGRWAALRGPVTLAVHGDHAALERALGTSGYPWLRAWAGPDRIDLQSPRSWYALGAPADEVEALLAHELAHCGLDQAAETAEVRATVPPWFREGLAGRAAGEDVSAAARDRLARFWAVRAGAGDPFDDPAPLHRRSPELIYAAGGLAVDLMVERHGEEGVRAIVAALAGAGSFDAAVQAVTGAPPRAVEDEVRRRVARR